jgi:cytidylate kinase
MTVTPEILQKQNAETSNAVIALLQDSSDFQKLSEYENHLTVTRDREDDEKLAVGIEFAKSKGVIDPQFQPEPYVRMDVLGKSPEQVADEILLSVQSSASSSTGRVIVLVGLSGTGKGTTVAQLRQKLEAMGEKVVIWSNGNIFRSLTLLATTWCDQNNQGVFDKEKALTKENLQSFMNMLEFRKNDQGEYDTHIHGLGLDLWVSAVQNTVLKSPPVSKNIPTVAEFTQGEVILFAAAAVQAMGRDRLVVLLEGREQTVNYVRTPHRFALILSDESLIGKRRAAQRLMAAAMHAQRASTDAVHAALQTALTQMVQEIH